MNPDNNFEREEEDEDTLAFQRGERPDSFDHTKRRSSTPSEMIQSAIESTRHFISDTYHNIMSPQNQDTYHRDEHETSMDARVEDPQLGTVQRIEVDKTYDDINNSNNNNNQ